MRSSSSGAELESTPEVSPEWKREANHRLAAHRARRGQRTELQSALPGIEDRAEPHPGPRNKSVADRVAARYAQAPSYSEMLAAEARNAVRAADAAAAAAVEARHAAQAILIGLEVALDEHDGQPPDEVRGRASGTDLPAQHERPAATRERHVAAPHLVITEVGAQAGWDEAVPDEAIWPVQPLPAKLLEFPRELVAARRVRPRLAEGPLREEYDRDRQNSQLRIFEVEAETISTQPVVEPLLPGWSSLRLDAPQEADLDRSRGRDASGGTLRQRGSERREAPADAPPASGHAIAGLELPLQTATLEDRLMAGLIDAALIAAGFLTFAFVFVACTTRPPTGRPAQIGAALALLCFALLYQLLFFCFGQDTPGMRYARIALCTFDDENPTRRMMRRRLGALLLSAGPFGLGILWAFFDDDRLGWHDRISRTYQRSYRQTG